MALGGGFTLSQCWFRHSNEIVALLLHSIYTISMGRKPKSDEELIENRLEQVRTKAGMTRQQLADAVDVHYQTIGYIERNEYSPSLVLALRIAKALNKKVEQIFSLEDDNGKQ